MTAFSTPPATVALPVLVACAHGTRGPFGRRTVGSLVAAVSAARPGLRVEAAFVDVQPPTVADVVRRVTAAGDRAVVVPLLLSGGYHVHVDIARAVDVPGATATTALGPDERLVDVLLDRLRQAGAVPGDGVVVAAAGSSDERSRADVDHVAAGVRGRWDGEVRVGYGASATPSVADAVTDARAAAPDQRVAVAAYLLAPGHFHDRLQDVGADLVTRPLALEDGAVDPRVVAIVLDRYDAAVAP